MTTTAVDREGELEFLDEGGGLGKRHPKCLGSYDEHNGDYDCGYGSVLSCEDCKYGLGRKDPAAKCNEL